jgi:hypothetical protein
MPYLTNHKHEQALFFLIQLGNVEKRSAVSHGEQQVRSMQLRTQLPGK